MARRSFDDLRIFEESSQDLKKILIVDVLKILKRNKILLISLARPTIYSENNVTVMET